MDRLDPARTALVLARTVKGAAPDHAPPSADSTVLADPAPAGAVSARMNPARLRGQSTGCKQGGCHARYHSQ
jgi:hypothetical protein